MVKNASAARVSPSDAAEGAYSAPRHLVGLKRRGGKRRGNVSRRNFCVFDQFDL